MQRRPGALPARSLTDSSSSFPAAWPPSYSVRVSAKALRARLRVLPDRGLEVVLPRGLDPALAAGFVERNRDWIERTLHRVCPEGAPETAAPDLPETVALHGGALSLPVLCAGETPPETTAITLRVRRDDREAALRQLRRRVKEYATSFLAKELKTLAAAHGFSFANLRFGCQRSRWGSCTVRGDISLNICLVFLPLDLARHVLLHELAHTLHCNHGQGFWKVLFAAEPNALALDKRLRKAWRYVPGWIWP